MSIRKDRKLEEETVIFLGTVSTSASSPAGSREEPLLILNIAMFAPAAATTASEPVWDAIPRIPKVLKGAMPTTEVQTPAPHRAVPALPEVPVSEIPALPEVPVPAVPALPEIPVPAVLASASCGICSCDSCSDP